MSKVLSSKVRLLYSPRLSLSACPFWLRPVRWALCFCPNSSVILSQSLSYHTWITSKYYQFCHNAPDCSYLSKAFSSASLIILPEFIAACTAWKLSSRSAAPSRTICLQCNNFCHSSCFALLLISTLPVSYALTHSINFIWVVYISPSGRIRSPNFCFSLFSSLSILIPI